MLTKQDGFTLLELLTTLAIAVIIVAWAVPSFRATVANNRIITQVNDIVTALNAARSESIKRGQTVTLCKSDDGSQCTNGSQWEDGWIVFSDQDSDGAVDAGDDEVVLVNQGLLGGNTLRFLDNGGSAINFRSYGATGRLRNGSGSDVFTLCDDRGAEYARTIHVNVAGRPRIAEYDSTINPINCS